MSTPKCKWGRNSFLVAQRRRFRRETVGRQRMSELLESRHLMTGPTESYSGIAPAAFVDVNGDRQLSPIDALQVINDMNEAAVMGRLPTAANRAAVAVLEGGDQLVPPDTPDGKTRISYLDEPFAGYSPGFFGMRYVKCHILTSDPGTVYFQDSWKYPFHYDFAREHLAPFLNMTREQFDAVSLRQSGQQVVLGTVLMSPDGRELAVQLVGYDAYPREQVAAWIDSVVASVQSDTALTILYMPTFEQTAAAEADRSWFAERGITVADPSRWVSGNVIYAEGWATGRLVRVPADQISAAYGDGRLRPTDILLLTDGVPAEVPFVRGIISLVPATPNSHVAILARNQRIPFVWLHDAQQQEHLAALDGKSVLLRASQWSVNVSALDDPLEPSSMAQWLAEMQSPKRAQVTPRETYGKWLEDVTGLTPDSIRYFGGKASHYGLLRRTIPENSQHAMAFSFDLWEAILSNVNPQTGLTLRQEIESRLGNFSYPPDMTLARAKLAEVNTLIRKTVRWTDAQKSRILSELAAAFPELPPDAKLRFRSSSNAEDSQELTGAGLYDSFSGCIADDTDGDNQGPSFCDPNEPEERGVLRAIEKVFASFYNENAWLERLRHQVPERDTGMAVLVHQNFPDEDEMANGVVTLKYRKQRVDDPGWGDPGGVTPGQPIAIASEAERWEVSYEADIVTQLGAISVTNPTGGTTAELVGAFFAPGQTPYVYIRSASSLVPIGGTVMTWDKDYTDLCGLIDRVAEGYAQLFPDKTEFTLDLEFKRMEPGTLIIKQVREIPAAPSQMVPPRLLNERTELQVLQSEFTDVWSHHRLKSTLSLNTRNGSLSGTETPLTKLKLTMLNGSGPGAKPVTLNDGPAAWPDFSYSADTGQFSNGFTQGSGSLARNLKLVTSYPSEVDARLSPVITPRDFTQELEVTYASPVPWLEGTTPATRTSDRVMFIPSQELTPDTEINTRSFTFGNLQITTRFKWWKPGDDNLIVKTLPVAEWVDTVITGLTTEPITLADSYAQSYGPGHHNFWEEFIFEPALDPSLSATQRAELAAVNVRLLHVYHNRIDGWLSETSTDRLTILGLDGVFQLASDVTLPDVNLRVGRQRVLGATGVDADGNSYTFVQPVWQIQGGATLTQNGATWSVTATQPGRWELTCTDASRPGITGRATLWVAGVVLDDNGTLQIIGTGGDDRISVSQQGDDTLRVEASFLKGPQRMRQFRLADVQRIEVHGRPGDDKLQTTRVNIPMWVDGGDGHDRLQGGRGDDVILGGQGRDLIWGGMGADILLGGEGIDGLWGEDGRNLLIGGAGADLLCGGIDEDILMGGMTPFSDPSGAEAVNVDALRAILNEWNSPRSRSVRRANLRDGSGSDERLNDDYFLQLGSTVLDDNQPDILVGRSRHWRLPS